MKSQIFLGISALVALLVVDERNSKELLPFDPVKAKVYTTQELIEKTEMNNDYRKLEHKQNSVTTMIRDVVDKNIIDSVIIKKDSLGYAQ